MSDYPFEDEYELEDKLEAANQRITELEAKAIQMDAERDALKKDSERYRYKLADIRAAFLGIDQQAKRLTSSPSTQWSDTREEIVIGYQLNTGLWHRILGLLADVDAAIREDKA